MTRTAYIGRHHFNKTKKRKDASEWIEIAAPSIVERETFEREVTGERIRDKIAASKKRGMWMGGFVPLGYDARGCSLAINHVEAKIVRTVFTLYLEHGNVRRVKQVRPSSRISPG